MLGSEDTDQSPFVLSKIFSSVTKRRLSLAFPKSQCHSRTKRKLIGLQKRRRAELRITAIVLKSSVEWLPAAFAKSCRERDQVTRRTYPAAHTL